MQRILSAFVIAVLIHTLLLTADTGWLIRRDSITPTAKLITMQLVERAPYCPPVIRRLPAPPPTFLSAPKKPVVKKPVAQKPTVKPKPVAKKSKPIAKKPPENSLPASPSPMIAAAEPEPESASSSPFVKPIQKATDRPPSPPNSAFPTSDMDSKATAGGSSPAVATVVMAAPRYNDNPPPVYPSIARKRGYEGTVVLEVFVSEDGRVGDLRIAESSRYRLLDRSAIQAVKRWQFEPGMQGDKTAAMWVRVPINFRLQ